ncbi:hypothetical protein V8E53_012174 [Lactarius tabidus]
MSAHCSDHNPPGDTGPPHCNPPFGPTANFISVLELFRAQRDSQTHPQAPPPSPSLEVHYLPDNELLALGDVLLSQITFVTSQEFEQLWQLVPSQPQGLPPAALLEAARIVVPFLTNDLINSSIAIMENIANHTDANTLPVASVPPEFWAALRAAIPSQGSRLSSAVASSPAFSTARITTSGSSLLMDDSPTNTPFPPLFLEASTSRDTPLNNEDNPIWVSSGDETPHANRQVVADRMRSFSIDHTPGPHESTPVHSPSHHAYNRAVSMRALINMQNEQDGFLDALMTSDTMLAHAETAVKRTLEELNEGVEGNDLPELETQTDALRAMATQIIENLQLDNGPLLPQDSIDGIRSTVWRAHEAHIRAIVKQEALKVEHRLSTMGLADLIDKLEHDAPIEEVTETLRDDILEQVHSKYNNDILAAKSRAYKQAMSQAEQEGHVQAAQDIKSYEANLMNTAKEQACLKADSEFSCILADERSKIAPRVDTEVAAEHSAFIADRRKTLISQLDLLSLEAEKEFVLAAAVRLGLTLTEENQPAKKTKHDHRQARPNPITPRGHSLSITSNTSQISNSKKRAYSPSVIEVTNPIPARETSTTPKPITTVTFALKQELLELEYVTPPTPSVIREAVNIADASLTPSLQGLNSSIHNEANQMTIDPETINYKTIFPPGIPAPPSTQLLPPRMSQTPTFGDDQALNDGVNTSITPSPPPQGNSAFSIEALKQVIGEKIQPLWDTICKLEAKIDGGQQCAPPRAGPGYRAEFINHSPAPKVSNAPANLLSHDAGRTAQPRIQAADPLPSANTLPLEDVAAATLTPLASVVCEPPSLDDEEFPALEQGMAPSTSRKKRARGIVQRQWQSVPRALGPMDQNTSAPLPGRNGNDGHIPTTSHQSRIKPLFANVITQAAVAQQQQVKRSVDQARTVQGRRPAGNQCPRPSLQDANLTEVTVIRFRGLEDEEEERKFRARNPIQIYSAEDGPNQSASQAILSTRLEESFHLVTLWHSNLSCVLHFQDAQKSYPPKDGHGFNYGKYPQKMKTTAYGAQTIFWEHSGKIHASKTPSFVFTHIGKAIPSPTPKLSLQFW